MVLVGNPQGRDRRAEMMVPADFCVLRVSAAAPASRCRCSGCWSHELMVRNSRCGRGCHVESTQWLHCREGGESRGDRILRTEGRKSHQSSHLPQCIIIYRVSEGRADHDLENVGGEEPTSASGAWHNPVWLLSRTDLPCRRASSSFWLDWLVIMVILDGVKLRDQQEPLPTSLLNYQLYVNR